MPAPGTVFQLKGDDFHRWVIVSGIKDGKVLAVNITDETNCPDSPCKLKKGDHSSLTKDSAVFYKKAREFSAAAIDQELKSGANIRALDNCSAEVLDRIIKGAAKADDLTPRLREYLSNE